MQFPNNGETIVSKFIEIEGKQNDKDKLIMKLVLNIYFYN